MTLFEKNMAALGRRDQELADRILSASPSSRITRRKDADGKIVIHAKGPDGEGALTFPDLKAPALDAAAENLAGARMVVMLGFGSGRLLSEVLNRTSEQTFVLLIEPDIDLFAAVLREVDMSGVLGMERLSLSVGESPNAATFVRVEEEYDVFTLVDFPVVENNWSAPVYESYFREVKEKLEELKNFGQQNMLTLTHMGKRWRDNIFENLPFILKSPSVSDLFGEFSGIPAFIIAAGPSLDKNAHMLASLKGKALVIAVDTAARKLLKLGVEPDIVVSLDANEENYMHLAGVSLPRSLMVFNPVAHPKIVREHEGPMVFTGYSEPLFQWLETVIGSRGNVRAGGSVATSAFDLAIKLGCSPITLVGQDLSYSKNRTHAQGTLAHVAYGARIPREQKDSDDLFETSDMFGLPASTSVKMEAWRKWFELIIAHDSVFAVNATEGGAPIKGARMASLAETINRYAIKDIAIPSISEVVAENTHSADERKVMEALLLSRDEARAVKSTCGRGVAAVREAISSGTGDIKAESLAKLRELSKEILKRAIFAETNRWRVDKTLDDMEILRRRGSGLEGKARMALTMETYRVFFSDIYETAAEYEKAASGAIKSLSREHRSGAA